MSKTVRIFANVQISLTVSRQEFLAKSSRQLLAERLGSNADLELREVHTCGPNTEKITILSQILQNRSIDFHEFCKKADLHTSKAYQIRAGKQRLGPAVRRRVAQAVGEPEETLFDEQGWPLEAQEVLEAMER